MIAAGSLLGVAIHEGVSYPVGKVDLLDLYPVSYTHLDVYKRQELPFRATKDVDIVLLVESITAEFGRQFWEYVKEAGYEHLNKRCV